MADLRRHADGKDRIKLGKTAHTLAGGCGIFGFQELKSICRQIEEVSQEQVAKDYTTAVAEAEAAFTVAVAKLNGNLRQIRTETLSNTNT